MREKITKGVMVLAVYPSPWGLGFAVFSGPWLPLDWGVKFIVGDKKPQSLLKARELIDDYRPDVLVVEDYRAKGSKRGNRAREIIAGIEQLAAKRRIKTRRYSRAMRRECFSQFDAWTKHEIAEAIGESLPEFKTFVPPVRKIWLPEHYNMNIMDAVALVFTFFYFNEMKKQAA